MKLYLSDPIFYLIKSMSIINRIGDDDSHSISIISLSECFEFLLPCSIPYLQFDFLLADIDYFAFEVDTNRGKMRGHKVILAVFTEYIGFAYPTAAYNE